MALAPDPRIEALLVQARGAVAQANARRQQQAIMAALGISDAGLLEGANWQQAASSNAGFADAPDLQNLIYGVDTAHASQGQAYRNAFQGTDNSFNARGAFYGSAHDRAMEAQKLALDQRVQQAIRALDTAQSDSVSGVGDALGKVASDIADVRWQQGQDAAQQLAPIPPSPAAGSPGGPGNPGGGGTIKPPSPLGAGTRFWGRGPVLQAPKPPRPVVARLGGHTFYR